MVALLVTKAQNWQPSGLFPLPRLDSLSVPPLQYLYYPSLSQTPQSLPVSGLIISQLDLSALFTCLLSPVSHTLIHPLLSCSGVSDMYI